MTRVLVKNNKTGKWNPTIKVDDHYGMLTEPGNDYLTHVTPKTGHGKVVARPIYGFLVEHELTNQLLYVAGCDGSRVNTGPNRGVFHHLEMLLARSLHYSICQLHGDELPFRAIFYYYDGKPSGPENWRGRIGQEIKEPVSDLPVIDFQPITFSDYPFFVRGRGKLLLFDLQAFVLTLLSLSIAYLTMLLISYVCFLQVIDLSWDEKYLY